MILLSLPSIDAAGVPETKKEESDGARVEQGTGRSTSMFLAFHLRGGGSLACLVRPGRGHPQERAESLQAHPETQAGQSQGTGTAESLQSRCSRPRCGPRMSGGTRGGACGAGPRARFLPCAPTNLQIDTGPGGAGRKQTLADKSVEAGRGRGTRWAPLTLGNTEAASSAAVWEMHSGLVTGDPGDSVLRRGR